MKHKLMLFALLIVTFSIRCAHLAFPHFFIVNPDSHFFRILSKQDNVPLYQSGLSPLLRYTGDIGAIIIPPFLAVCTAILIYFLATKMFNKNVGLLSVAVFSTFQPAALAFAAGNIDRDCLSIFLVTAALTVYFLRSDVAWSRRRCRPLCSLSIRVALDRGDGSAGDYCQHRHSRILADTENSKATGSLDTRRLGGSGCAILFDKSVWRSRLGAKQR